MSAQIFVPGIICCAALIVGALHTGYQIYKIVVLDSESRGMKHPKLWGLLATGGNHSSGLLMYLITRRKHPITNISEEIRKEIESRKKRAGIGIIFLAAGAIGCVIVISQI